MHLVPMIAASLLSGAPTSEVSYLPSLDEPSLAGLTDQYPSSATAVATSGLYLRLTGGLVTTQSSNSIDEDIDFDEGWALSLGVGQRIGAMVNGPGFTVELEGVWTDQDADDQGLISAVSNVQVLGALLNGIVDYRILDRLSLYGGGGLGIAWLDTDTKADFEEEDGPFFAWQLKAGVAWRFGNTTGLHVGYRFMNVDDAEIDDNASSASFDLETRQHVLEAGLLFGI